MCRGVARGRLRGLEHPPPFCPGPCVNELLTDSYLPWQTYRLYTCIQANIDIQSSNVGGVVTACAIQTGKSLCMQNKAISHLPCPEIQMQAPGWSTNFRPKEIYITEYHIHKWRTEYLYGMAWPSVCFTERLGRGQISNFEPHQSFLLC